MMSSQQVNFVVNVAQGCNDIGGIEIKSAIQNLEEVWEEILDIARRKDSIQTLGLELNNEIIAIKPDKIIVISERTGKERPVRKEDVRMDWEILASKGSLRIGEEKSWHGSIVAEFLAELPFIDYTLRPRTLYLRK